MTEVTQASGTPAAVVVETPAPEGDQQSQQPGVSAVAQAAETPESELKKSNDKLSQAGRDLKTAKDRADRAEAEVASERSKRQELWYTHPDTPEAEKAAFRLDREQTAKEGPKLAQLQNRIVLSDAIADEENPVVRAALKSLRAKAEVSKKYPDADTIAALRESLTPEGDGIVQPVEPTPPNVGAGRGTRAAGGPSIDEQIKELEKIVKANPSRYGELLSARAEKTAMERAASR